MISSLILSSLTSVLLAVAPAPSLLPSVNDTVPVDSLTPKTIPLTMELIQKVGSVARKLSAMDSAKVRALLVSHKVDTVPKSASTLDQIVQVMLRFVSVPEIQQEIMTGSDLTLEQFCWFSMRATTAAVFVSQMETMSETDRKRFPAQMKMSKADIDFVAAHKAEVMKELEVMKIDVKAHP